MGGEISEAADEVISYLAADPNPKIFLQGGEGIYYLVRVIEPVPDNRGRLISVSNDSIAIATLNLDSLGCELNKLFSFERFDKASEEWVRIDCPTKLTKEILSQGRWRLPRLTAISAIPVLCKDGSVIEKNGYHRKTGIFVALNAKLPSVPKNPTKADAAKALELLRDWLKEFSYQKPEHESSSLSEKLTCVGRLCLKHAPLHTYSAVKPGEGKGTHSRGTGILVEGSPPSSISFNPDAEEFRKKLTSILLTGQRLISIDNVTGVLGGDFLESILTEEWVSDRLLGTNISPKLSTQVTIIANGNNLRFRSDMARRVILSVLDSGTENPEKREFKRNFEEYTQAHRGELVAACLTILKAYIHAGYPNKLKPLGSFEEWSDLVRSSLVWLGMPDPVLTQKEISAQDDLRTTLGAFLRAWIEAYPPILGRPVQKTARDICSEATHGGKGDLRDILLEVALDRSGDISPRKLSYFLRANHRSVVGNLRLESEEKDRLGYALWSVCEIFEKNLSQPQLSSASSAESSQTTVNQGFEGAEDQNLSSAVALSNGKAGTGSNGHKRGGYAEDQNLSSAGLNNGKSRVSGNCAEDAEDSSQEPQKFAKKTEQNSWEGIE